METIDYGDIPNSAILTIFGDEMAYNDLMLYSTNQESTTNLKVEHTRDTEIQLVRVWFDNKVVMDKKYSIHHSCNMFYHLNQLVLELELEDELEDE